jgi:K+-transporting ATPase ATPase C chain
MLLTGLGMVLLFTVLSIVYTFVVLGIGQGVLSHQANGSLVTNAQGQVVGSSLLAQGFSDDKGNPLPRYFQPRPSEGSSGSNPYDPTFSGSLSLGPTNPKLIGFVPGVSIIDGNGQLVKGPDGKVLATNPFATPTDPYCVPVDAKGNPVTQSLSTPSSGVGDPKQYAMNSDGSYQCDPNTVPERALAYRALNGLAAGAPVPVDAVTVAFSGLDPDISIWNAQLQTARVAQARNLPASTVAALVERYTTPRSLGILGEPGVNVLELNLALDRLPKS